MASTSGSLELGVVTEVELNLNHQSYFTLTENAVTGIQKGSICSHCSAANLREDPLPPPSYSFPPVLLNN